MEVVNPFILKNKIGMVKFIDELCNVDNSDLVFDETPMTDTNNNGTNGCTHLDDQINDPAHDLAIVHKICENYRKELDQLAGSSQGAKKLVTILKILSQHKQYYANLQRSAQQTLTSSTLV